MQINVDLDWTLPWPTINGYRLAGDISHVVAIILLIFTLIFRKNARGISGKTQLLYTLIYSLRYMDMWFQWSFVSYYNTAMKIFFIASCSLLVYMIYTAYRETYDMENDSFQLEYLIIPVTLCAFFINHENTFMEMCWTWSIYMEALALIPQLYMIWNSGYPANSMVVYILLMGIYRGMYICNWAYRYYYEHEFDSIVVVAGIIETSVALLGFIAVFSLKLRLCTSMNTGRISSIYTLPHIAHQLGKDYKRIPPTMSLDLDEQDIIDIEKRTLNNPPSKGTFVGARSYDTNGGSTPPSNSYNSASQYYVL